MKQIIFGLLLFWASVPLYAQTNDSPIAQVMVDTIVEDKSAWVEDAGVMMETALPLSLPFDQPMSFGAYGLDGCSPYNSGVYGTQWRLHKGFNAQLGMSVHAAFGKHAPKGVGFGQSGAFAYVLPINSRLSLAAGIYASNLDWGAWRQTDAGISGTLAYHLNERINLYAYASKSFMPKHRMLPCRYSHFPVYMRQVRDRIGAAAEFKIGQNAVIGVSVEHVSY